MPASNAMTSAVKAAPAGRIDMRAVQEQQKASANRFKERSAKAAEQTEKLVKIGDAWKQALETKDIDTLKILNADFDSARRESAQNTKDLSGMMSALVDGYRDIGVTIKAAEAFNIDEEKITKAAHTLLEDAKGKLVQAQAMGNNWFNRRDNAIARAKTDIETAEAAVKTATGEAETMRRSRLNNMNLNQSMQLQQAITAELTEVAQGRITEIEANLDSIQANVTLTMDGIKADTAAMEGLDKNLAQANAELGTLNEELASYTDNSSDWQGCRDRIIKKTRERDNIEAERNAAFMRTQEGERFIEFNKMEEQGQIQLLSQHKIWISLLQMGSRQRDILYQVHLGLMQGAADQESMSRQDEVLTATDERLVSDTAMMAQAMRKNTLDRLARTPEQVRRLREITKTEMGNQVAFEKQFAERIEEFHHDFGSGAGYDDRATHRGDNPAA